MGKRRLMVKFLGSHQGEMDLRAAHQQLKEELGFDHFEGRSWQGLHCHAHDDDPHMPSVRGVVCAARLKNEEDRPIRNLTLNGSAKNANHAAASNPSLVTILHLEDRDGAPGWVFVLEHDRMTIRRREFLRTVSAGMASLAMPNFAKAQPASGALLLISESGANSVDPPAGQWIGR